MTPWEHSKNEPSNDSLQPVLSLQVGDRAIEMQNYTSFCSIGYYESSNTFYWTWVNWSTKHGPFNSASEAFLAWEKLWNRKTPTRPDAQCTVLPVSTRDILTLPTGHKSIPSFETNRSVDRGHYKTITQEEDTPVANLVEAKFECKIALGRVIIRQAYPSARVSHIAGCTYRVNKYEQTAGIVPFNKLTYSFLVDVIDGIVVRRPEVSKKLVKYSDHWTQK